MKKILIVLIVVVLSGLASAQGFKLGVAGNIVFPTGEFSDITSGTGWGIDGFAKFDMLKFTFTVRAGYVDFGEGEGNIGSFNELDELVKTSTTAIPVMVGIRWGLGKRVGPSLYVGAEAGIHSFKTSAETAGFGGEAESDTEFAFAPIIGAEIARFDISAYYMIISEANYLGLRVGYGLGI